MSLNLFRSRFNFARPNDGFRTRPRGAQIFLKFNRGLTTSFYSGRSRSERRPRVNVRAGEREERRTRGKDRGCFGPHRRARTCVHQYGRGHEGIRESHRGIYLDAFFARRCTRIIRKTPPIMIIRTLHRDPDVCPWHVRSGGISVRDR